MIEVKQGIGKYSCPVSISIYAQAKFLLRCSTVEDRFSACPDPNYGHICFYEDEWACGGQCIGKTDVCELKNPNLKLKGSGS